MMEKQRSFSVKPIRFLVFSFTISFSIIFLIFFSTWVFRATHLEISGTHNLDFSSTLLTVQSSKGFNTTSSVENSILIGAQFGSDENSSQIYQKKGREVTSDAESRDVLLAGKNLFVDGVNISHSTHSAESSVDGNNVMDGEFQELENSTIRRENGVTISHSTHSTESSVGGNNIIDEEFQELENSTIRRESTISFERPNISIRNGVEKKKIDCDISKGRWVVDESYPLYTNATCPFIDEGFNCEGNGRMNKDYMKWRWEPQDCDIPRFNATKMLELIRGKRLVFVGDSLNRNQWESMLCLLMGAVKDPKKVYEARGRKITKSRGNYCFKFEDYKCTVEYYVSHFLVHESKAKIGNKRTQTLRIDAIDKGSSKWRGADILVFNTAHWWSHSKTKAGINYYQEGNQVHTQLDVTKAFRRSLLTWASWVDKNINPHKTRIFFRSSAPSHFSGGLWNSGGHCREAFRPINETFTSDYPEKNLIVEEIISQMMNPVTFLNITRLSDYRPDAHPSIYGRKTINKGVQDCSHWCLPGVPDSWNELLYYNLQLRIKDNFVE